VKLDGIRHDGESQLVANAVQLTRAHLLRRPADNPVERMRNRLDRDIEWLRSQSLEMFHRWAFGFCRQGGANAELAADFVDWLAANDSGTIAPAADAFRELSSATKALQFNLARAARGRAIDVEPVLDTMQRQWDAAMAPLVTRYA
jgi:hypothetical protein